MSDNIKADFPDWCRRQATYCRSIGERYDADMFDEAGAIWTELTSRTTQPVTPAGGEVVYAVNTGELDESGKRELYTLTDQPIPMADNQKLYTNQLPDGMVMVQIRDAKALARFAISNAGDGARGDTKLAGMRVAGLVDAALNQRGGGCG